MSAFGRATSESFDALAGDKTPQPQALDPYAAYSRDQLTAALDKLIDERAHREVCKTYGHPISPEAQDALHARQVEHWRAWALEGGAR